MALKPAAHWHWQHRSQYGGKILIQLAIQQKNKHRVPLALIACDVARKITSRASDLSVDSY